MLQNIIFKAHENRKYIKSKTMFFKNWQSNASQVGQNKKIEEKKIFSKYPLVFKICIWYE